MAARLQLVGDGGQRPVLLRRADGGQLIGGFTGRLPHFLQTHLFPFGSCGAARWRRPPYLDVSLPLRGSGWRLTAAPCRRGGWPRRHSRNPAPVRCCPNGRRAACPAPDDCNGRCRAPARPLGIENAHHVATHEIALHRHYALGQQAGALLLHGSHGALIHLHFAVGRACQDPALAPFQRRSQRREQGADALALGETVRPLPASGRWRSPR